MIALKRLLDQVIPMEKKVYIGRSLRDLLCRVPVACPWESSIVLSNKQPSSMLPEPTVALVLIHTIPAKPSVIEPHLHPSHSRTIQAVSVFSPELGPAIYVFLHTREFLSRIASVRIVHWFSGG